MWRYTTIIIMAVLASGTAIAEEDLTGQDAPPLECYEIITAGGAYGDLIDIDDFLGKVVLINFWSDS